MSATDFDLQKKLEGIKEEAESKLIELKQVEAQIEERKQNLAYASDVIKEKLGSVMDSEKFINFFRRPYIAYPSSKKNELLVFVPKFIQGFQVGWLLKEDETFYVYKLDQYSAWLGEVPKELLEKIDFRHDIEGVVVSGSTMTFPPILKDIVKQKLGEHLKDISENEARIIRGHEFQLISDIIEAGTLPFKPTPIAEEDKREPTANIKLRDYQKVAEEKFFETGALGVFHPTGAGKSYIAFDLFDKIKGKKLVIVPTRTLADQWAYYIETVVPRAKDEIKIVTYQGFRSYDEEFVLTVYDECVAGDTKILMADGKEKMIRDVQVGEWVMSATLTPRRITYKWNRGIRKTIRLDFSNGKNLVCTPEHKIFSNTFGLEKALYTTSVLGISRERYARKEPEMPNLQTQIYDGFEPIQALQRDSPYNTRIQMSKMWEGIPKSSSDGRSCGIGPHRPQQTDSEKQSLEQSKSRKMGRIQKPDEQENVNGGFSFMERWQFPNNAKTVSIRGLGLQEGMLLLWTNNPIRRSSQRLEPSTQCERECDYSMQVMPRKHSQGRPDGIDGYGYEIFSIGGHSASVGLDSIQVISIDTSIRNEEVFDIEVETDHSFIANGVAVANCQRLPADTFSRLAVIRTKYRLGLSASPYREDGRESYIFALTGFPIGLNWKDYMETVGRSYHPINVYVSKSLTGKLRRLNELLDMSKKTIIFCDTIELGKRIAKEHNVPYVFGESVKRLDIIQANKVLVASRVLDLGVSIKDLQRIIEVDFLFGSRQQELQRTGRLMHSEASDLRHDILFTENEMAQYGKRLWALQEKGFTIRVRE